MIARVDFNFVFLFFKLNFFIIIITLSLFLWFIITSFSLTQDEFWFFLRKSNTFYLKRNEQMLNKNNNMCTICSFCYICEHYVDIRCIWKHSDDQFIQKNLSDHRISWSRKKSMMRENIQQIIMFLIFPLKFCVLFQCSPYLFTVHTDFCVFLSFLIFIIVLKTKKIFKFFLLFYFLF